MVKEKRKIVFLVNGPLTERWISYFCLDELDRVFDIEFWDCSYVIEYVNVVSKKVCRNYVHSNITWDSLEENLNRLPNDTIIVPEIAIAPCNFNLFHRLSPHIHYAISIDFWHSPVSIGVPDQAYKYKIHNHETFCQKIVKTLRRISFECWWKYHFQTYYFSIDPRSKYPLNAPDVEKYLTLKETPRLIKGKYIVYVGQFFPFHSDTLRLEKRDVSFLAPLFYKTLNTFFDNIERKMNCRVIIAEHPSAKHEVNPFNGREIIYYKTAELIRDSMAVCMHFSNSSSFVVLYDKPVAVLSCDTIQQANSFYSHVAAFANAIEIPLIDMNHLEQVTTIFRHIQPHVRKRIIKMLMPKGCEKKNAEKLVEYINTIPSR